MEASRIADIYGCFEGNTVQGRDVEQAYLQAEMEGPPVYISLPRELWTDKMKAMRDPVVRLEKALYGHKHSGVFWQRYCKEQVEAAGFTPVSENWPCVFYNYKTCCSSCTPFGDHRLQFKPLLALRSTCDAR